MPLRYEVVEGEAPQSLKEVEAWYIVHVLIHTQGKIRKAAEILGVHRNTLARKMKFHKIPVIRRMPVTPAAVDHAS